MPKVKENHLIFSDESGYCGNHRFGSIAVISGPKTNTKCLNTILQGILVHNKHTELKFSKIKGHSSVSQAVKDFICCGLRFCSKGKIKIHVIIWDKKDSRNKIQGRDNIENMKRMYYHILKRTKSDWKNIEDWEFYPDEFTAINWHNDVIKYLENTNLDKVKDTNHNTLFGLIRTFRFPSIHKHGELQSDKYPILQLADLFAGLIRLSYTQGEIYNTWLSDQNYKNTLFPMPQKCNASHNEICKFLIMKHFKDMCSQHKLGVNFSKNKYFTTFHGRNGIVIWLYQPQGEYDKSPTNKVS